MSGYDVDIAVYAQSMEYNSYNFYYLREPIIWLGQRWLFQTIGSDYWVFVFFDLLAGLLLYSAFKRLDMPQYTYFSFLTFFPFVLGFQNIYRQWFSQIIFIFCISLIGRKKTWSHIFLILSMLSHNVAGMFIPIFLKMGMGKIRNIIAFLFIFCTPVIMIAAEGTKSSASTGANLVLGYLSLLFGFVIFFILSGRGVIKKVEMKDFQIFSYIVAVCVFAAILLSSSGAERFAMFGLFISYPLIAQRIEKKFRQKIVLRMMLSVFGFLPVLIFGTRIFII